MAAAPAFIDALLAQAAAELADKAQPGFDVTLVPSLYTVLLSPTLYAENEPLFPFLRDQVERRLDAELDALRAQARRRARSWLGRLTRRREMGYDRGQDRWTVRFEPDPEGRLSGGEFQVYAALSVAPDDGDLPAEDATHLVAPRPAADAGTRLGRTASLAQGPTIAVLTYTDDAGDHEVEIGEARRQGHVKIGRRAGPDDWRDVPIDVATDVSRDHARLRYDAAAGRFELQDRSRHGTTIDGVRVPPNHDPHAEGPWVPLPPEARIELAGVVTLHFRQTDHA